MTPAELIEKYLQLRRKLEKIKERHEEEIRPYKEVMQKIEGKLLEHLNETGLDSTKCAAGTAFGQTVTSVTVENWDQVLGWLREHEAWDLLEARVAKNATLSAVEENQAPVPGVKISQARVLRVRSAGA